ncbi:hypothetical protein PMIN07_007844 [Paraphaeosphaeria minitans]
MDEEKRLLSESDIVSEQGEHFETPSTVPELQKLQHRIKTHHAEHGVKNSDYQGVPSNVTAAAWTALLQPFFFNASASGLSAASVSPADAVRDKQSGYLASLGVYHELHCLVRFPCLRSPFFFFFFFYQFPTERPPQNQLRNLLYLGTGPAALSSEQITYYHSHLDHCIEAIRLSSTCNADLSLYTFTWPREEDFTFLDAHSKTPRKCVDWGQVEKWSMERKVELALTVMKPGE